MTESYQVLEALQAVAKTGPVHRSGQIKKKVEVSFMRQIKMRQPAAAIDHRRLALSHLLDKGYVKRKVSIRDARQKIYEISKLD